MSSCVDIGTQGTKAALMDISGRIIVETFKPSNLIQSAVGSVEQDPTEMLADAIDVISQIMQQTDVQPRDISCIAFAGQMAGILGIDHEGQAITPYDSWLDQRCSSYWDHLRQIGEAQIINLSGGAITYAHAPKILWWKYENPPVYEKIASFIQPAAYIAMKFCELQGNQAFIDYTYLHFSGFADTQKRSWSESLLKEANIDAAKMPRIVKPWDIVGHVSKSIANAAGLLAGTPVAAGCGDTAASIFGAGVTRPGLGIDVSGSASVFSCAVNNFAPDVKNRTLLFAPSVIDHLYTPMAYISGGGLCLKWLRDQIFTARNQSLSYEELDKMAYELSPGSDELIFIPHFAGRVCPNDESIRGSWIGLTWKHNQSHLFRSVIESIGYEYSYYFDIMKCCIPDLVLKEVVNVGGGANSLVMRQIKADILNIPWTTINRSDTGVVGIGVISGFAVGLFDDLAKTVERFTNQVDCTNPDAIANQQYAKYARAYQTSLHALKSVYQELLS